MVEQARIAAAREEANRAFVEAIKAAAEEEERRAAARARREERAKWRRIIAEIETEERFRAKYEAEKAAHDTRAANDNQRAEAFNAADANERASGRAAFNAARRQQQQTSSPLPQAAADVITSVSHRTYAKALPNVIPLPQGVGGTQYGESINLARQYLIAGRLEEAGKEAARARLINRSGWEANALIAATLYNSRLFNEAAAFVEAAIPLAPDSQRGALQSALAQSKSEYEYEMLLRTGARYFGAGSYSMALMMYYRAWELFPARGEAGLAAAVSSAMAGDRDRSISYLNHLGESADPRISMKAKEVLSELAR